METITSAEMRALEEAAIASGTVTGLELMERAGQGVVDAILAEWPDFASGSRSAVVLCGPGNNGGDGFVVARLLKNRGWQVEAIALADQNSYRGDAATNYQRLAPHIWHAPKADWSRLGSVLVEGAADLIIDAVFGIGLSRALAPEAADLLCGEVTLYTAHDLDTKCVAVDVPSGLHSDTGEALAGRAFTAHLTVTFHRAKPGHLLKDGPKHCGTTVVVDIGL